MQCPSCGTRCSANAKYCSQCGAALQQQCPSCSGWNSIGADACGVCGKPLDTESIADGESLRLTREQARSLARYMPRHLVSKILAHRAGIVGERKQATFLFADIVGSTALGERFDEEVFRSMMSGALQRMIRSVYRYEGTVGQLRGDEVFALFGVPIVHEDDPERAVRAAFDIRTEIRRYADSLSVEYGVRQFDLRVTLNTGDVVVGDVGGDLHAEYTAMGDAVNTAAKMQAVAKPGTIVISEETHRLVKRCVNAQSLGAIPLKGKRDPVQLYEVVAIRSATRGVRGVEGLTSALVGRTSEMNRLEGCLRKLRGGQGQVVFLVGEAGLGKSRLVSELKGGSAAEGVAWVEGQCVSFGRSLSYHPFADALREWLHVAEDEAPHTAREKLTLWLDALFGEEGVPEDTERSIARVLSLDDDVGAVETEDPEDVRRLIQEAVMSVVRQMASQQPVVFCIDDMHWADRASLELARMIAELADSVPVLLLCLTRQTHGGDVEKLIASARERCTERVTEMKISPLSATDGRQLLGNLLDSPEIPAGLQDGVLQRAEGNPLFVEELLHAIIDRGSIVRDGTDWRILEDTIDTRMPRLLLGIISDRIDRLAEGPKESLRAASVLGREFSSPVLEAMISNDLSPDVETCLKTLEQAELVTQIRRQPHPEFRFRHELIRQAAYDGMLGELRAKRHRQAGDALRGFYGDRSSQHAAVLAHHYRLAADWEPATQYLLIAARRARAIYSNDEAIELLSDALELAERLEGDKRGDYTYEILKERAAVLALVGHTDGEAGDLETLAGIAGSGSQRAEVALLRSDFALRRGRLEEAMEMAARSEQLYKGLDDRSGRARALGSVGVAVGRLGRLEESRASLEKAVAVLAGLDDPANEAIIRKGLGTANARLGLLDQAVENYRVALDLFRDLRNRRGESEILGNLGSLHYMRVDYEEAIESFVQAQRLFHDLGNVRNEAKCSNNLGLAYVALGNYQQSVQLHEQAGALYRQVGDQASEANALSNLAIAQEALAVGGDPAFEDRTLGSHRLLDRALENHRRSLEIYTDSGDQLGCMRAQFNIGCVKLTRGEIDEAMACLVEALELSRKHGLDDLSGRVLATIARAYLLLNRAEEALECAFAASSLIAETSPAEADEIHFVHFRALLSCNRRDDARRELKAAAAACRKKADRIRGDTTRKRFLAAYHRLLEAAAAECEGQLRP